MQVDASGQQELSAGVDLAIGWSDRADGRDPTARDREVRARVTVRRDDGTAADRDVGQSPSSSSVDSRSASSWAASASMRSSMSPSIRRSRFEML